MKEIITNNENETLNWAKKFIKKEKNTIVLLDGNMGAGKTVIVRGFARGLGIKEPVTSPTFTLINEYSGKTALYHFDLYRITTEDELYDIGFEEYLEKPGIKVFEWSSKFDVFKEKAYHIYVEILDFNRRKITINEVNTT